MRALRVLGIAENGGHLVCVEAEGTDGAPETFALPLDDRLRAAVRGDLSRFGQLEIEMEPQLRPREIQSRIRAGATVEQVAAAAGCTAERIERYAYPVLMERATAAERARRTRPLHGAAIGTVGAASAGRTLEEIVTATLTDRGQHQDLVWDAFRDERGWTVTAIWRAGRSENRAEWAYHPGPDGGTVAARNQVAADLVDPAPRPLRTIGDEHHGGTAERGRASRPAPTPGPDERLAEDTVTDERSGALPARDGRNPQESGAARRTGTEGPSSSPSPAADRRADGRADQSDAADQHGEEGEHRPTGRAARRGHRPPMPSWEDVLLGTRASGR